MENLDDFTTEAEIKAEIIRFGKIINELLESSFEIKDPLENRKYVDAIGKLTKIKELYRAKKIVSN